MKTRIFLINLIASMLLIPATNTGLAQDVDSVPPVVVKTLPEAGGKDVSPGVVEIKITFSKKMKDQSWSWSTAWKDSDPQSLDKPRYENDGRTCVVKVRLDPGKTYGYWINSQNFHGFKDEQGRAAVPYLFVFHTKAP